MTPSVQRIVEFAKRVPGFGEFLQDDQLILIKLGFFEVWLSHAAKAATDHALTFDDGVYVSRQQLEVIYDVSVTKLFKTQPNIYMCFDPKMIQTSFFFTNLASSKNFGKLNC